MDKDGAALARAHFEAFNARDLVAATALVAEDVAWTDISANEMYVGPEGHQAFLQVWLDGLPDAQFEIHETFGSGEFAAAELTLRGTNTGPLLRGSGHMAPQGKKLELRCCAVFQLRDGRIGRAHFYFDLDTVMHQLGLHPGGAAVDSTGAAG